MKAERLCNECGAALPKNSGDSTCPSCLLQWALGDSPENAGVTSVSGAHGVERRISFGDYELIEEIDRGGMGVVYKARQISLNRVVALKMILAGQFAGASAKQRFKAEAEAAARLRHPHIVGIHEVGEHDGFQFFSMDYIEGADLGRRLKNQAAAPRQAAEWVKTIAETIHYAHEQGILHRDLKPSNILLDLEDQPHVTDFGLAKEIEADSNATFSGQLLGSPNYVAPEQAAGRRNEVGRQSDVYSLGAILYELLTGRPPFIGQSVAETVHQVLHAEVVAPRLLNPNTPRDLETICLKCLEKDPNRRYRTAQELADELARFLRDEPIRARPVSRSERGWRWCRRNPVVAGLSAGLVLVFCIGFAATLWQLARVQRKSEENREQLVRMHVVSGANLMQDGDYLKSLLWFAEALRADAGASEREEIHRMRFGALLQECPRLVQIISHDGLALGHAAFSPIDEQLATIGADHTLRIWSIPESKVLVKTTPFPSEPFRLSYSPDGARLLVTLLNQRVWVIDAKNGLQVGKPITHWFDPSNRSRLNAFFDAAGRRVISEAATNILQVWDASTGERIGKPMVHGGLIQRAQLTPDEASLLTQTSELTYHAWDLATGEPISFPFPQRRPHESVLVSPQADRALVGTRLLDLRNQQVLADVSQSPVGMAFAAFSPSGKELLVSALDRKAQVWAARTGKRIGPALFHDQSLLEEVFSPDGSRVCTRSADETARIWGISSGGRLTPPLPAARFAPRFSASGRYFLTLHPTHLGYLWDLDREAKAPAVLQPLSGASGAKSISGGEALVSREADKLVRFQDLPSGRVVSLHPMSIKTVPRQAWSDTSGRFVIVEGEMATVQVWEASTGLPVSPLVQSQYTLDDQAYRNVELPPVSGASHDLVELAKLISGSGLDQTGGWKTLELAEIVSLWESLKQKFPTLLGPSRASAEIWHRREAQSAEGAMDWAAAAFHWGKLPDSMRTDGEVEVRYKHAVHCETKAFESERGNAKRFIPPRDPRATPEQIDLTGYYNAAVGEFVLTGRRDMGLSVGLQRFGETLFDLRGIIRLFGTELEKRGDHRPREVGEVKIEQRCQRIHFLHSAQWAQTGEDIAIVVVNYRNGHSGKISMRIGGHLNNDIDQQEPAQGRTAWIGTGPFENAHSWCKRIYTYSWTNPHPDLEISHLDLISSGGKASYVLLALTIESAR